MAGRKTKYKKEYNELLIEHMASGLSFESFAGEVGVTFQTLYNWAKENDSFFEAKALGTARSRLFWENMGVHGAAGQLRGFNYGCWYRNMENRFNWKEKVEVTSKNDGDGVKDPSEMSDEELESKLEYALDVLEKYGQTGTRKSNKNTSGNKKKAKKKATNRGVKKKSS